MQAAGVIPIASNLAALSETIARRIILLKVGLRFFLSKENFEEIEKQLSQPPKPQETRQRAREIGRERAENSLGKTLFSEWNNLFIQHGVLCL